MSSVILVGADVHSKSITAQIAIGLGKPILRRFDGSSKGRKKMIMELLDLAQKHHHAPVWVAFEASCGGFGFYDELTAHKIEARVLAPSKMPRSSKKKKNKSDVKDALHILELLRGHVLAQNELPAIWVPPPQTRDDRELVRGRIALKRKEKRLKVQIKSLLKRNGIEIPQNIPISWRSNTWLEWLKKKAESQDLEPFARKILVKNLEELEFFNKQIHEIDSDIRKLANTGRYKTGYKALVSNLKGVGLITAMVFLTEIGDPFRFHNRQQIGAYLGLTPGKDQSDERDTPKHITHQGPARVSEVLCQAAWTRAQSDPKESEIYTRICKKNPKRRKIAIVALMRRLGVRMWHCWKAACTASSEITINAKQKQRSGRKICRGQ